MSDRPARASLAVAGVLVVLALLGALVALGAAAGPGAVVSGRGRAPTPAQVATQPPSPSPSPDAPKRTRPPKHYERVAPAWIGAVFRALLVLVGLGVAVWLAWLAWQWLQPDYVRRRTDVVDDDDLAEPEDLERVARRVAEAAEAQQRLLASGPPGEAVIACWLELERTLAAAGVPRQPWETSSELTVRVLGRLSADPEAVRRLERRYREARFSEHPVGEDARAEAIAALEAIRTSLQVAR